MKVQKTVEVDVCDRCGEVRITSYRCGACSKELCWVCCAMMTVTVQRHTPNRHIFSSQFDQSGHEAQFCMDCADQVETRLRTAGFHAYARTVRPV